MAVGEEGTGETEAFSGVFRALSEPLRLDIVRQITQVEELPCTTLEETLPISKSTISYHIKILSHAGLIQVRKEGRYYFYSLREDVFEHLLPGFLSRLGSQRLPVAAHKGALSQAMKPEVRTAGAPVSDRSSKSSLAAAT